MAKHPEYRLEALAEAGRIISGDRDVQYGAPEDNFERIAKLWSVLFEKEISAADVSMAMILLKAARYVNGSHTGTFQGDSWIDIAGYAGTGYEVDKLAQDIADKITPRDDTSK